MSEPYTTTSSPGRITRSGDAIDLPMLLAEDPIEDDQAATKQYVDANQAPPANSGRIPTCPGRWFLPTTYETVVAQNYFPDQVTVAPLYVAREVTWTGMAAVVTATLVPYGDMRMGLYELDEDNDLKPKTLMWESGNHPLLVGGRVYQDTFSITTTANWIGLGITHFNTTKIQGFNCGTNKGQWNLFGLHDTRFGSRYGRNFFRTARAGSHPPDPSAAAWSVIGGHDNENSPRIYIQLGSVP